MTKEEAIKHLHTHSSTNGSGQTTQDQHEEAKRMAIKALETQAQWIPCKWHTDDENLPKECKSVLVCIDEKSGYKIGVSYRSDYNRWEGYGRVNVVAWMPQPEPYKGDQE